MAVFNKVEMSMLRTNMYGHYILRAKYRGKNLSIITTNSEAFDWLDDPSDKQKHLEAKRYCLGKIREAYEKA